MVVFCSSALHSEQRATMNIFEIAIGKSVSSFGILAISIVDTEMPFHVLTEPVHADKLVLLRCRRLMPSPSTSAVGYDAPVINEILGERKPSRV